MFKCLDCGYTSNRKYNLQLHYKKKHKKEVNPNDIIKTLNDIHDDANDIIFDSKDIIFDANDIIFYPNDISKNLTLFKNFLWREKKHHKYPIDLPGVNSIIGNQNGNKEKSISNSKNEEVKKYKCVNCGKEYKKNQSLKKHSELCNGTSNNLECPYCHKIFTTRGNKSRHITPLDI
tara:strand:- start:65 stop:592 length:528 start_codon:yes stop_codon:yes gene_type:complete